MVLVTEDTSGLDIRQLVKRELFLDLPFFVLFKKLMVEHHVMLFEVASSVNLINLVKMVEGLEVEQVLAVRWRPLFTYPGSELDHGSTSCPPARRPRCLGPASKPTGLVTPQSRQGSPPDAQTKASDPLSASKLTPAFGGPAFFVIDISD